LVGSPDVRPFPARHPRRYHGLCWLLPGPPRPLDHAGRHFDDTLADLPEW